MKNSGSLIVACLVSAAAGVAIGMLLAPDKGENIRKNIKDKLASMMQTDGDATVNPESGERVNPVLEGDESVAAS